MVAAASAGAEVGLDATLSDQQSASLNARHLHNEMPTHTRVAEKLMQHPGLNQRQQPRPTH